ncbi:hypothetical protein LY78DRAFT_657155 [Colletotrichum sublineola]|nr:hypothetical protein LY78DRAFT_657155 [Colletotrichum sublineola]
MSPLPGLSPHATCLTAVTRSKCAAPQSRPKQRRRRRRRIRRKTPAKVDGGLPPGHFNVDTFWSLHFRSFSEELMEPVWNS